MTKPVLLDDDFKDDKEDEKKLSIPIVTAFLFGVVGTLFIGLLSRFIFFGKPMSEVSVTKLMAYVNAFNYLGYFVVIIGGIWFQRWLDGGKADTNRCNSTGILIVLFVVITKMGIQYFSLRHHFGEAANSLGLGIWSTLIPGLISLLIPGLIFSFIAAMILQNK